ncbi:MAG: hypothetical protein IJZ35_01635 [Clostridia bacterium]|nr:hypothetical protein [Clostridia bacterium]
MDRKTFDNKFDSLFTRAESLIPEENLPDLPFMALAPDVHDWYKFEHELWEVGENIRQFLSENKNKLNNSQIDRIVKICLDKRAKRGRQSFVLLLGRKMYCSYSEQIVALLNDDDVDGQVIDTLYKMGAKEYAELIEPFLTHNRAWIRNEAKRYVQKYKK